MNSYDLKVKSYDLKVNSYDLYIYDDKMDSYDDKINSYDLQVNSCDHRGNKIQLQLIGVFTFPGDNSPIRLRAHMACKRMVFGNDLSLRRACSSGKKSGRPVLPMTERARKRFSSWLLCSKFLMPCVCTKIRIFN